MIDRVLTATALLLLAGIVLAQGNPELQQKAAAAKEIAAANRQSLLAYEWLATTELKHKGEVKATLMESCKYGPDGKVQKTALTEPPPQQKQRGIRGKIAEKKKGEMKAELQAAVALAQSYVPPTAEKIQAAINAGNLSVSQPSPGMAALRFDNYSKDGDALVLEFNQQAMSLARVGVDTWLNDVSEPVTIDVDFKLLPDGTNYADTTLLSIPESDLEVRITNSNYRKPVSPPGG